MKNSYKAFPSKFGNLGMDLRDYFAAMAMQGMVGVYTRDTNDDLVMYAYEIADKMMEQREK
jgi:hypothetical protein